MNRQELLLRQLISETLQYIFLNEDIAAVGGGASGVTKKIGTADTKGIKGFLDVGRLSQELKVPSDKLRTALKDANKGKRKPGNDKVFGDTILKVLGKPKKEKDKIMNIIKKVELNPDEELKNATKDITKDKKAPKNVNVAM